MAPLPTVTALMPAYNAAPFVAQAVLSALGQEYPEGLLDLVVVDDGSTDATAEIVAAIAAEHPSRVKLVHQENRGLVGAVNSAFAHASGELIALLDADDVWLPGKIARQVEALSERPAALLIYSDLIVIDAQGEVLDESWLKGEDPPDGSDIGALLEQNLVTASSVIARRELFPVPPEMPWADWWLAVRAAQLGEVAYLPEPSALYRFHGDNMSLGTSGPARLRELRKGLALQRWFLRSPEAATFTRADLIRAWAAFERNAGEVLQLAGTAFAQLVEVTDGDRDESLSLIEEAASATAVEARTLWVRACAADPSNPQAMAGRLDALADFVVLVRAEDLLETPSLLPRWAEEMRGIEGVTLAIDAHRLDQPEAAIRALVAGHGVGDDTELDLLALTAPQDNISQRVDARYGNPDDGGADGIPTLSPDLLHELRTRLTG
jgi:glycosyltransferase involved in cell wall biosynthesis